MSKHSHIPPAADSCCASTSCFETAAAVAPVRVEPAKQESMTQMSCCASGDCAADVTQPAAAPVAPVVAINSCCSAPVTPIRIAPDQANCCTPSGCSQEDPAPKSALMDSADGALLLRIPAMDCPVEEAQIRKLLDGNSSVTRLQFDLPARTLKIVAAAEAWETITAKIQSGGFKTEMLSAPPTSADVEKAQRRELLRLIAALVVAAMAEMLHLLGGETTTWKIAGMVVAAVAIGLSGLGVFQKGLSALFRGQLNINALMSVAVIGAFVIGQWPEAAMVMALYSLAELIEARSVERARNAIAKLLALSPPQMEVKQADGSWVLEDAKSVAVGALARVKPGERFALDGVVTNGQSAVDQASVTGESIPVDKAPGDEVFAGTINQSGSLEFKITKLSTDTVLARIIHAVEEAQGQRAPMQRFVDKFAAIYTPAVFVLAIAVAVVPPLMLGWAWLTAIYKALVLLVIACPCALVISTPVTVVSGLSAAARRGILVKGGVYLEEARKLRVVALDKTGTVTAGKPQLVDSQFLSEFLSKERIQSIAKSLSTRSDHPVSKAVASGLDSEVVEVANFAAEMGRGVRGNIDGQTFVLGNHRWIHERGQCSSAVEARMHEMESQGKTVSVLAGPDGVLGLFAVADTTKETSKQAVAELKALGIRTVMLTGDNEATAKAIAAQVGIDEVKANLLPEDKLKVINELVATQSVGMVGDGVNDSPSLAAASIGFSMGGAGTDIAKEAADVLIMNDDLRRVPETVLLSKRTYSILWQNIILALGIKAVFFVLAVFGNASMWMAVFADMGASLIVVFNGLRLLRGTPKGR